MNKILLRRFAAVMCTAISYGIPLSVHAEDLLPPPVETISTSTPSTASSSEPSAIEGAASSTTPTPTETIPPAPISITLDIETPTETLYRGPVTVTACPLSPTGSKKTVSGYCAIEQSGVTALWSWYGNSAFIDSLNGTSNDYAKNAYWNWFSDLTYGMTALNEHELHAGESLLVTIERMPLRLSLSPDTLTTESTTTATVLQFGFDANFNAVWEPARESTVFVNGEPHPTSEAGTFAFVATSSGISTFVGSKNGYLSTAPLVVNIVSSSSTENTVPKNGSGGSSSSSPRPRDTVTDARDFLMRRQNQDGSFQNSMLTDWAAIALTSAHAPTEALKSHMQSSSGALASATDIERHMLALEALGIDPSSIGKNLLLQFDETQIGDPALINDDIFGIIALSHAGYGPDDLAITRTVAYLLQKQSNNGSWENTDLTSAAIQALSSFRSLPGVTPALARARTYLLSKQQMDGCFGNSFTTSWSSMAITALGESPSTWRSPQGNTPLDCLSSLQVEDGGFEEGTSEDTRVWATAYALPALMGYTWDSLLRSFPRKQIGMVLGVQDVQVPETEATTTIPVALEAPVEVEEVRVHPEVAAGTHPSEKRIVQPHARLAQTATSAPLNLSALYDEAPRQSLWSRFVALIRTMLGMLKLGNSNT